MHRGDIACEHRKLMLSQALDSTDDQTSGSGSRSLNEHRQARLLGRRRCLDLHPPCLHLHRRPSSRKRAPKDRDSWRKQGSSFQNILETELVSLSLATLKVYIGMSESKLVKIYFWFLVNNNERPAARASSAFRHKDHQLPFPCP